MKWRDISLIDWNGREYLAIACDVCASIGEKNHDVLRVPLSVVGAFNCRVVLMELLALGAEPIACTHLVGNEYDYTGKSLLAGLESELEKAGYNNLEMNGSSEENMATHTTCVGVTMLGRISKERIEKKIVGSGDLLVLLGRPLVGRDVLEKPEHIVSYDDVRNLHNIDGVSDILPIGSKGIVYEAQAMANHHHVHFQVDQDLMDSALLRVSGGPATALLVGVSPKAIDRVLELRPDGVIVGKFA